MGNEIALQQCNLIIQKQTIKYLIQKEPAPPQIKAQLKLHKPRIPIRPVINNTQAPTYKVAKHLTKMLDNFLTFNNYYDVTNSTDLATVLDKLHVNENHRLMAFEIQDLFVNIPIQETLKITKSLLLKNNNPNVTQQIIELLRLILSQNYFTFQNKIHQAQKGISKGSPISSAIAEIFLQHMEEQYKNNSWILET
jgi:hypothetical protein